jgi:hypothetical protein
MTQQHDLQAEAATEPEPEVKPEVIQDLNVTGDDADDIVGGAGPIYVPRPITKV